MAFDGTTFCYAENRVSPFCRPTTNLLSLQDKVVSSTHFPENETTKKRVCSLDQDARIEWQALPQGFTGLTDVGLPLALRCMYQSRVRNYASILHALVLFRSFFFSRVCQVLCHPDIRQEDPILRNRSCWRDGLLRSTRSERIRISACTTRSHLL